MFLHPMFLAVIAIDLIAISLILSASKTAYHVLLAWNPQSSDKKQLRLEIDVEASSIKVRAGASAFLFSTIIFLIAISNVLPGIVSGAMCGTGVMQAIGVLGKRVLVFRFTTVFILFLRSGLEKLDRTSPDSYLIQTNSGLLLMTIPLIFFSLTDTFQCISGLEIQKPVDCCAALYDSFRTSHDVSLAGRIPDRYWVAAFISGAIFLAGLGLLIRSGSDFQAVSITLAGIIISLLWVFVSSVTLVRVFSAYHFQVLHHHCPWCLFLTEHYLVGYPAFGALAVTLFESVMAFAAIRSGRKYPGLKCDALKRTRKAGTRLIVTISLFLMISLLPAIFWRMKYGVWIGG